MAINSDGVIHVSQNVKTLNKIDKKWQQFYRRAFRQL